MMSRMASDAVVGAQWRSQPFGCNRPDGRFTNQQQQDPCHDEITSSKLVSLQQAKRLFRSRKSGSENSRDSKSSGDKLCSPAVVQHSTVQQLRASRKLLLNKLKINEGPGFLNININPIASALVITVIEARGLQCPTGGQCNSFVKVRLLPDHSNRIDCCSQLIYDCNNPVYDEKISFQVLKHDYRKRLMIGVFHQDLNENCIHLLGSMSFGIHSLLSKSKDALSGWYYLLPEEFGHFKHKKVKARNKDIAPINKDVEGMKIIEVRALRNSDGFGFSIGGGCPCQITRILNVKVIGQNQPMVGDYLIRINSRNVSRATLESVVRLIRKCKVDIRMELCRPHPCQLRNALDLHSDPFYPQSPLHLMLPYWSDKRENIYSDHYQERCSTSTANASSSRNGHLSNGLTTTQPHLIADNERFCPLNDEHPIRNHQSYGIPCLNSARTCNEENPYEMYSTSGRQPRPSTKPTNYNDTSYEDDDGQDICGQAEDSAFSFRNNSFNSDHFRQFRRTVSAVEHSRYGGPSLYQQWVPPTGFQMDRNHHPPSEV